MAVVPQDIPEGGGVSLGDQLPGIVRAKERPWKRIPPLVTCLFERDRLFEPPVLKEAVDPVDPEAQRRISIRYTLERVVKELRDRRRGDFLGVPRFAIDRESIGDQQRARSEEGINLEARVAEGLPNHGGVERRTDAADALAPPQGLRDEKAGDLNLSPSLLVYLEDVRPEGRRPYKRVPLGGLEERPT